MKKIINSKYTNMYLGIVIPLVMIYIAFICLWSYIGIRQENTSSIDVLIIFLCSFLMVYGIKSLFLDLKLFGIRWVLKNFFKSNLNIK